jgi:hypothetical protein
MNACFAASAAAVRGLRVSPTSFANRFSLAAICSGVVDTPIRHLPDSVADQWPFLIPELAGLTLDRPATVTSDGFGPVGERVVLRLGLV